MNETEATPTRPPHSLAQVFGVFLRVGLTGYGGAMSLLAQVQEHAIERHKVATPEEFTEGVALGQLLPGPIVVDAVAYLGYRLYGAIGAILSASAIVLPAFVIMLVATPLYFQFGGIPRIEGAFRGIGGAVVALVLAAAWRMGEKALKDWRSVAVATLAFGCLVFLRVDASLMVLLAGALGLLVFRPKRKAGGEAKP